jgi:hypothetical protein
MRKLLTVGALATSLLVAPVAQANDAGLILGGTILGVIIGSAAANADNGHHRSHKRDHHGPRHQYYQPSYGHQHYYGGQVILRSTPYCWNEAQPRYDHHGRWVGDDVYRVCR